MNVVNLAVLALISIKYCIPSLCLAHAKVPQNFLISSLQHREGCSTEEEEGE